MRTTQVSALLGLAAGAAACAPDFNSLLKRTHRQPLSLAKRDEQWPPVLSEHEAILVNSFDNITIDQWSYYYGRQDKLAGFGKEAAEWTRDQWAANGFDAHLNEYNVFLRYPISTSLTFTDAEGNTSEVNIKEDVLEEDEVTGWDAVSQQTFLGYAAGGSASAEYVYAGRGSIDDFQALVDLGVSVEGKIALIRYGGLFRGLKVKNAQDFGAIGAVIFLDPGDDGEVTVANGYAAYPDGPARNPNAQQKGSTLFLSTRPGDPTTPGYPSHKDAPRADISDVISRIPAIPISYGAAEPLLQALQGHGVSGEQVNRTNWVGGLDAGYFTGPAPGVKLNLDTEVEDAFKDVHNVIGWINGTESDETIFIGNHRDTWMIGGNGDPNSGSAVLIEFTKALNHLRTTTGWQPKRNIALGSWDAEEWGLIGSTEWVEEHDVWLTENLVAYLNLDVAVSGPRPNLGGTPELHKLATETMKKVIHPSFGAFNQTLYSAWEEASGGLVGVLGSGSDYTPFLHRGVSSLDIGSSGGRTDPIWHYHSNYDTYHWMATWGDPGFHLHASQGQYLALLVYHLATDDILPIDVPNYAVELRAYYDDLAEYAAEQGADLDLSELDAAIEHFRRSADEAKALERLAVSRGDEDLKKVVNRKYRDFQRGFISQGGLPDREFYRHVVTAPGLDTGYAAVTFPGITEGVQYAENGDFSVAQEWVGRTARGIVVAADILKT
ncbi:Zn-dependent exopeptidase [Sodiomyces alkalinus F11]|uniref:Zn-dependent exopeptidase n=1 Tax=Sodiomyces alkalinus (strain CBS 110278 / VKM F-3762 / F11) TaxID=1314773 RepID=A0A3N2PKN3_SODAK|nr:Zn-dependent exopeptidase [Sodiomyces alkalinus F11]ROT35092.1 Zn-dependent exopeptidase [Sodiomyces alkalinus F11]